MLSYFRINDPYRIFGLLAIQIVVFLPLLVDPPPVTVPELKSLIIGHKFLQGFYPYSGIIDSTAPFTNFMFAVSQLIFGDELLGRHILGAILIFCQAVFIGIIYIDKRVFPENSFVPSLIFSLLFAFSFDALSLSGELFGLFFILLALNSIFKEIEFREETSEMVLKVGIFIGIASLFAFSFIVFVPAALLILLMYTRSTGRKLLLLIVAFLIPHLLTISFYFIYDGAADLWQYFYLANLGFSRNPFLSLTDLATLLIVPIVFLTAALVVLNRESRFTKYQSQVSQAMFFWTVFSIIQIFYTKEMKPQTAVVLIPGFSFFIAHFFLVIRRRMLSEIAFWILLIGLLIGNYYTRYFRLDEAGFQDFVATESTTRLSGRKMVILDANLKGYVHNQMSTPFLNWSLSKKVFDNPEYYENVILIYEGFRQDPPDVIVDPSDLMAPFLRKIPELTEHYEPSSEGYKRRPIPQVSN